MKDKSKCQYTISRLYKPKHTHLEKKKAKTTIFFDYLRFKKHNNKIICFKKVKPIKVNNFFRVICI